MRKEQETPHKEHAPSPNRLSKKTLIPKKKKTTTTKSLFTPDVLSLDSSPISVIIDDAYVTEIGFQSLPDPALSPSTETLFTPHISQSSESTMSSHASWTVAKCESDDSKFGSMEAEVVASFLKQARTQVFNSAGVDAKSKKLLDALVEIVVQDFHTLPEERDQMAKLLSAKAKIRVVCLLLCSLAVAVFLVFSSGSGRTFHGPLPT